MRSLAPKFIMVFFVAIALTGCSSTSDGPQRDVASIPMNSKSLRGDQIYQACLKERSLKYCNNATGRY